MVANLLLRGMIAGVVAGLLVFCIARLYGEPQIDWAIAYEERSNAQAAAETARAHADEAVAVHSHGEEDAELVSRPTQAGFGLFTGVLVFSVAMGGLFSLVFAATYGRLGELGPRGTAALIALAAFVAITMVPQLKYPANPPAVGNDDTIGLRTGLFFIMLASSVAITTGAFVLAEHLRPRLGSWNAVTASGIAFIVLVGIVWSAMPAIQEVPADFSATVLWNFRVASLGMHAALWLTLGLLFGQLAEWALKPRPSLI